MTLSRTSIYLAFVAGALAMPVAQAATNHIAPARAGSASQPAKTDPLYTYQWHLMNSGQKVIGDTRPVAGIDLNIDKLHTKNVRGKGVKVAVVDDGLEIRHADLLQNVVIGGSKNFVDGSNDPTPANTFDEHGTSVSGIIGAVGWNGIGGRGVAPEASLKGFNFLSSDVDGLENDQDTNIRYAWGNGREAKDAEVFNNSWGSAAWYYPAVDPLDTASWEKLMSSTRDGKGGIYLKAAGNSFKTLPLFGLFELCEQDTLDLNIGCSLANTDSINNFITTIVVASVNASGKRASYSSPGSAVWISGLGGEFGYQKKYYPDTSNIVDWAKPTFYDPAIVTTDLTGCGAGSNADRTDGTVDNALDTSASPIDKSCDYWGGMNGTSAATPTVAGVVALMLGVNPNLSARDVKYILAQTARQVDPLQPKAIYQGAIQDPGWITNAAGLHYSNWYGFGLVDATAAVRTARNFLSLPAQRDTGWLTSKDKAVPIQGVGSQASKLTVNVADDLKVEAVQLGFTTTHQKPRQLRVILTSPSGTKSYVMPAFSTLTETTGGFAVDLTSSNAFLDEPSAGNWTVQVLDMADSSATAQLQTFNLRVVGH